MSTPEILWNDLCASISDEDIANSMDTCAADDGLTVAGWTVPPVVMVIAKWAIAQATKYGCEYRDQIMTAVRTFVVAKIPNPMLQGMILAAAETMVLQQCG
jgi:hypothetical protein